MQQQILRKRRPLPWARLGALLARRPQRSFALPAVGAAVGLLIAGVALLHPAAAVVTVVPPGYVALVNGQGILLSDFIEQAAAENGEDLAQTTAAQRRKVLHEMIDKELLVQRGLALDLPETTTEVRTVMATAVNEQVAAPALASEPTDADLMAFYRAHRSEYSTAGSMTVHDLVLHVGGYQNADQSVSQAQTDAAEAAYQLRSGASIAYVEEHFGLVDSGRVDNQSQLDWAAKIHLGDKLYKVAAALGAGDVSDPVTDTDGVHVLVMDRREPPRLADFVSVRDRVYRDYRQMQTQDADQANLQFLRRNAHILLAPGHHE